MLCVVGIVYEIVCVFCVGCFIFCSCFVYLAVVRVCAVGLLCDYVFGIVCYCFFVLEYGVFFCVQGVLVGQMYCWDAVFVGVVGCGVLWGVLLVEVGRVPFDYVECESELVCGVYTEWAGMCFVLFSVGELSWGVYHSVVGIVFCFGGVYICFKVLWGICAVYVGPRVVFMRMRVNVCYCFVCFYVAVGCTALVCGLMGWRVLVFCV